MSNWHHHCCHGGKVGQCQTGIIIVVMESSLDSVKLASSLLSWRQGWTVSNWRHHCCNGSEVGQCQTGVIIVVMEARLDSVKLASSLL